MGTRPGEEMEEPTREDAEANPQEVAVSDPRDVTLEEEGPGKLPLAEKVDMTLQRHCSFTLMDTIEDGVRVRLLNVWAFLLVYIFFVFGLLRTAEKLVPEAAVLEVSTPMSHFTYTGGKWARPIKDDVPDVTPKVGIFDNYGNAVKHATCDLDAVDFTPIGPLPCSASELRAVEGTLLARRYIDTCNYGDMNGTKAAPASAIGLAPFEDLNVRGPAGLYTFAVRHGNITSPTQQKSTVSTPVASLQVVDPDDLTAPLSAPVSATVGQPLLKQPAVLVRDANGLPVANRVVTVFVNPEPTWPGGTLSHPTPEFNQRGQKFADLACATSEPSDERGLAKFTCLGVSGTTADHIYFVFSESGFIFKPWNDPVDSPGTLYPFTDKQLRYYRYATRIVTRVTSVRATNAAYEHGVREGVALSPAPTVRALDEQGGPVPSTWCYAIVTASSGQFLPLYFRRSRLGHRQKELFNARARTDSNGVATFSNLSLSVYGNTLYDEGIRESNDTSLHIGFVCDGKFPTDPTPWSQASGGFIQSVQTRVATVMIQRFTTDSAYVTSLDASQNPDPSTTFVAVVRVLDADGRGVAGKTVIVKPAGSRDGFVRNAAVQQEPTSDSGFAVVSFTMASAPPEIKAAGHTTFRVKFVVDGVESEDSKDLTARLDGDYQPSACHLLMFTALALSDSHTGDTVGFNALEQVPEAMSGSIFAFNVFMLGQTFDTCVHDPALAPGGPGSVNMSGCPFAALANASGDSGRALSSPSSDAVDPGLLRHLAARRSAEDGAVPRRRLSSSSDESIKLEVLSAYSDDGVEHCDRDGHCEFVVKNEPRNLLNVKLVEGDDLPTFEQISAAPTFFVAAGSIDGPQGDHFIKLKVTLRPSNTSEPQTCYSPPLNIRIKNRLASMEVEGDAPEPFAKKITQDEALDIKVKLVPQDPDTGELTAPSNMPPFHLATSNALDVNQVYWKFIQYPEMWNWEFFMRGAEGMPPTNPTDVYGLEEIADAWDADTGTLSLRMNILKPGLFGRFALIFGAAGLWSRVFTFEVLAPPLVALEVLQAPGFGNASELSTQTYLPQQPAVRVTVGGQPLVGAVLAAEVVPEEGAVFARLTDIQAWSLLPLIYSEPTDADGVARWQYLSVMDGRGCARFKFMLAPGEVETSPVPAEPLCFRPAYGFQIKSFPPATLPVGAPLSSIGGAPPLTVEAQVEGAAPSLLCPLADPSQQADPAIRAQCGHMGFGFMAMRVMVSEAAGEPLNRFESVAATQSMLQDNVCIWVDGKEPLGRCSDLEFIQWDPFVVVRFQVKALTWARVTKMPAEIKLVISDLSASSFVREEHPIPAGFFASSPIEQTAMCMDAMMKVSSDTDLFTTGTIAAESKPASADIVLSPPKVVTMGKMFLVKLQLLTKYGSPVRGKAIRVCIAKPSSLIPGIASPSFLQALGAGGFTLGAACDGTAKLDPMGTVRVSRADGTISFPLTVETGRSGSYKLLFQAEEPGANILAESVVFRLFNPITEVSSADEPWGEIQVEAFGKQVEVPRRPIFRIQTSGGETLDELEEEGVRVKLRLQLKGVSELKLKARAKIMKIRKAAVDAAIKLAKDKVNSAISAATSALADIAPDLLQMVGEAVGGAPNTGIFANFAPEFVDACASTAVASLGFGDPAEPNSTEVQETSMSDEVAQDPSVIGPLEQLSQFIYTLTSGGDEMQSAEMMQPLLNIELDYDALVPVDNPAAAENTTAAENWTAYTLKEPLYMNFQPNFQYQLVLTANGVTGSPEEFPPFTVEEEPLPPTERAFNWFVGCISVILAAVVLVTNTRKHHYRWCFVAISFCLGVILAVPYLEEFKMAMGGYWNYIAYIDLIVILGALIWSLGLEVFPQKFGLTFQEKRMAVYEEYAKLRFSELLFEVEAPKPTMKQNVVAMFKPFSAEHAFYFPSNLLAAGVLAFGSFVWIFWQTISLVQSMEDTLNAMLNRAIGAILRRVASINERVYANLGRDLPNSATDFLYSQLDLVQGWFQYLISALYVGMWIGIVVAFVVTLGVMFFTFYDFRRRALELRRGSGIGQPHVHIHYSASFVGVFVSSTVIGFAMIVLVVTLVCLPFSWPVLFDVIWSYRNLILLTLLPYLIKPLATLLFRLCAFGPDFFRNRALASIYFFYETYLSIASGIFGAFVRFGMGLAGLIIMLPCVAGPNVPAQATKMGLKDGSHTTYLSAVLTYHLHNAPLFAVAAQRLLHIREAREQAKASGRAWPSSKCLVLLLLLRFPALRKYRKHALADAAKRAEEEYKKREELAKIHAGLKEAAQKPKVRAMRLEAAEAPADSSHLVL